MGQEVHPNIFHQQKFEQCHVDSQPTTITFERVYITENVSHSHIHPVAYPTGVQRLLQQRALTFDENVEGSCGR